jgi:hypothetical protein
VRVVITEDEYLALKKIQSAYQGSYTFKVVSDLIEKIEIEKFKATSTKKLKATKKATQTRENNAKRKIESAINILRFMGGGSNCLLCCKRGKSKLQYCKEV